VQPQTSRRYGTAGPGPGLFKEVWAHEDHVFAAEGGRSQHGSTIQLGHPNRVCHDVLNQHPVEVLVIEEGEGNGQPLDRYWTQWMNKCRPENRPDYILVSAPPKELVDEGGLQSKGW
jgi:hypothetical protein